jgi:phosphohistidine phosphatase
MLNLILIRHAHAGPHTEPDMERSLSERGIAEAKNSAKVLKYSNHLPGTWLISSANRTKETSEYLLDVNQGLKNHINIDKFLYGASGKEYLNLIEQQMEQTIYVVGHNPSISFVANYLLNKLIDMGTADIVHLQWTWTDNWKEISKGTADLIYHFNGN